MKEESLLSGPLETTNEPYAIAKIAGIKMCQAYNKQYGTNFISVMPTNLYGPGDNYDLETSHVVAALIRKIYEAKINEKPYVEIWGSGVPLREILHVDDLADACLFLIKAYNSNEIINIGTGKEISIIELANMIKGLAGYKGKIIKDLSKPDGMPRKLLDVSKISAMGWKPKYKLHKGLEMTYKWYANIDRLKAEKK
jgi:GDP-L-fucose synthase